MKTIQSLAAVLCAAAVLSSAGKAVETGKAVDIEPTSIGAVMGRVYDAETLAPIKGAMAAICQDGDFAPDGRSVAGTNESGEYACQAALGRVTSRFDLGRALGSGFVGAIGGGANKKTKRVDISRLALRVTADGYKQFEGIVSCRGVDASGFAVTMEPILLASTRDATVSTTADGWGVVRILDVKVDPPVVRSGSQATVRVRVKCPLLVDSGRLEITCVSTTFKSKRLKSESRGRD